MACSVEDMKALIKSPTMASHSTQPYQFDHVYPGVVQDGIPLVILYTEIGSKTFATFHDALMELAKQQKVKYILRHYVSVSYARKASMCVIFSGGVCSIRNFRLGKSDSPVMVYSWR